MFQIMKRELRANLKSVLIWSLCMFLMALVGFGEYAIVMGEGTNEGLESVVNMMPRIIQVMFGMGTVPIDTPAGWYVCMFLWCALIAYIHAALLGATILSKEERDKTSEFLFTRPIKRSTIISGKIIASLMNSFLVVFAGWAGTMIIFARHVKEDGLTGDYPITIGDIHITMLGMFFTSLIFLFVGLCFSAIFKGRGKATQYASIVILLTYFIAVAIEMVGDVDYLNFLTPFRYFDAARVLDTGLEFAYILLSLALTAVTGYFTYVLYGKRNLHS